jgi:hypothetical protein
VDPLRFKARCPWTTGVLNSSGEINNELAYVGVSLNSLEGKANETLRNPHQAEKCSILDACLSPAWRTVVQVTTTRHESSFHVIKSVDRMEITLSLFLSLDDSRGKGLRQF